MSDEYTVNGHPLPKLLTELLRSGRWRHPGDDALQTLIPFSMAAVDFLNDISSIERESSGLLRLAADPASAEVFYLSRGSHADSPLWRSCA